MGCEIAHIGCNGVTVYTLIHRQIFTYMRKSFFIHSHDQNHKSPPTSSTSLSHFHRGDADLSASVGPLVFGAWNTIHSAHISSNYAKLLFPIEHHSSLTYII